MNPLPLEDRRHLEAAEGWLGLDAWQEANEELEQICPSLRAHPSVLFTRFEVYAKAKKWDGAFEIAQTLVVLFPDRPEAWICWAYSTRRQSEDGLVEAKRLLVEAAIKFPAEYLIRYNLACYTCRFGDLKESLQWLKRAFDLSGSKEIKLKALEDPDLEPLWSKMGEILKAGYIANPCALNFTNGWHNIANQ